MELSPDVRNWWVFVLRGLAAILFGLLAWLFPGMALLSFVILFGAYAVIDGGVAIAAAVRRGTRPGEQPRWLLLLHAIVSLAAGFIAWFAPGITALALVLLIGARALVLGALEIAVAISLRHEVRGEWLVAVSGLLSVIVGALLLLFPGAGALGLILWIGAYAVAVGVLLVALGMWLRGVVRRTVAEGEPFAGRLAGSH